MKKIFIISLFCFAGSWLAAYSAFGEVGFLQQNLGRDFYSTGAGYTGSADLFRYNASLINPSMVTTANNVKISSGFSAGWRHFENDEEQRDLSRSREYDLPYLNIVIPYKNSFFALDFASGYSGSYKYSYSNIQENFFADFYKLGLVYAHKTPWFNIGVGGNYYLGSAQKSLTQTTEDRFSFEDTVEDLQSEFDSTKTEAENFEGRAVFCNIGISKKFENFSIGAYYYPNVTIESDNEISTSSTFFQAYQYADGSTDSSYILKDSIIKTKSEKKEIKLPEIYGFGLTYYLSEVWKFSLDADYQIWQNCSYFEDVELHNTFNFGVGIAYDMNIEPWYWNIPLRMGYYRKEFPFEVNKKSLIEQGVTLGFDIPVNKAEDARASVALQYSTRGSKSDNGYSEQELKISIGFTGFDIFSSRSDLKQKREIPLSSQNYDQY